MKFGNHKKGARRKTRSRGPALPWTRCPACKGDLRKRCCLRCNGKGLLPFTQEEVDAQGRLEEAEMRRRGVL